ncbi:aminoglycoside phosphotransferase family protein [Pseudanabaena yagii]|uniref:Aminoglycoside phosphotransferase family protein n=1 Tax=Pseudanabaena yagii GIHE-NHR1 TaxID=2722753 RepID=A0ABX1LXV4_9CYAN|nr:aminoglycoside phosphotransferase family protein [Pseudanabaena yagii]NMF61028.1 aminoglycoside phosphotransferase family protein [Pseudanabaena yagii GIHE-NHR1]
MIDIPLVYKLLKEQHPDLADLPIQFLDAGLDNAMFRLGDRLSVRLPRREVAAKLIENEQTWLPIFVDHLPIPIPNPYRIGQPNQDYPYRWSILPWLDGISADREEPDPNQAKILAKFLRSLHIPAPANAPKSIFRGVPLTQRAAAIEERIQRLEVQTELMTLSIKQTWQIALNTPIDVEETWIHGDLHSRNILVKNGVIAGIIDWGDMTSGDIATDLAAIWMLFRDRHARQQAISTYADISEATLQRAKGWAIAFGVMLLDLGLTNDPRYTIMGKRTLQRLAEDI